MNPSNNQRGEEVSMEGSPFLMEHPPEPKPTQPTPELDEWYKKLPEITLPDFVDGGVVWHIHPSELQKLITSKQIEARIDENDGWAQKAIDKLRGGGIEAIHLDEFGERNVQLHQGRGEAE